MKAPAQPPPILPVTRESVESGVTTAAHAVLEGRRRGLFAVLPFAGPAFVASVAYVDPGNFATNIQGGSEYGYRLLWAIVLANLTAMLMQTLSAKLGIASGRNLAELCGIHFRRRLSYPMWIVSEIGAMATDLAEFLGAALGLNLLFHLDLRIAVVLTGLATYAMLGLQRYGVRRMELLITALVGVIAAGYLIETIMARPDWGNVAYHSVVPYVGNGSVLSIVGIIGATVMPHVIYLHSALTQRRVVPRSAEEARRIFRLTVPEVVVALGLAGLINMAMLYMAASTFNAHGLQAIADIPSAYHTLTPLLGQAAGTIFAVSLLASGLSSSVVGTMAGQVIMQGFVGFSIPLWVRRLVTMVPTIVIVFAGVNPTQSLFYSQVVLSLVLPLPILALLYFTGRRDIMGTLVNRLFTTWVAGFCAAIIVALNLLLVIHSAHELSPGLVPAIPGLSK